MDFLKKHYEKVLLGVMLAGLIGLLVFMLFYIASQTEEMKNKTTTFFRTPKGLTNLDTTIEDAATARLAQPYTLDFETTNKLLNPMKWQKSADGALIRADTQTGPQMVVVTNITPLYLIITLESSNINEAATNYVVKVERQAAATKAKRQPVRRFVALNEKPNDIFGLDGIQGPPENPTALIIKLADTTEEITVPQGQPYRRIDGYTVDFRYDPERKAFAGKRVGDIVSFGGVDYSIDKITANELILMDQSNQKKTSLSFNP
jgi:hypothetical protein